MIGELKTYRRREPQLVRAMQWFPGREGEEQVVETARGPVLVRPGDYVVLTDPDPDINPHGFKWVPVPRATFEAGFEAVDAETTCA